MVLKAKDRIFKELIRVSIVRYPVFLWCRPHFTARRYSFSGA